MIENDRMNENGVIVVVISAVAEPGILCVFNKRDRPLLLTRDDDIYRVYHAANHAVAHWNQSLSPWRWSKRTDYLRTV